MPCSAIGTLHKQPEIRYKNPADFAGLPLLQHAILSNASSYVKPGGRLLYTTCTLNRSENYEVVRSFLSQHPDGTVTILPSEELDGFYVALLQKQKGEPT